MEEEFEFVRAIAADPYNSELRLMFADWCEERGDERGEALRIYHQIAQDPQHPRRQVLLRRANRIVAANRKRSNAPIHRYLNTTPLKGCVHSRGAPVRGWKYSEGLITKLTVETRTAAEHADVLAAIGPIRHLRAIGEVQQEALDLEKCPAYRFVEEIEWILPPLRHYSVQRDPTTGRPYIAEVVSRI